MPAKKKTGKTGPDIMNIGTLAAIGIGGYLLYEHFKDDDPGVPGCTPGDKQCVGTDLYECSLEGKWILSEENSPECPTGQEPALDAISVTIT